MKRGVLLPFAAAAALVAATPAEPDLSASPHVKVRSVGLDEARWTGGFWGPRISQARAVTLPAIWKGMELRGNGSWVGNLRIAAGLDKGDFQGNNWSDGDIYKWLEGVSLAYALERDPALDRRMDEVIALIAQAQAPDGYISTNIQLRKMERWKEPRLHEVYNMGHLFTAAVVHQRATGKTSLLAVARKAADHMYSLFHERPAGLAHFSAPSNLMGMVELYRATGDRRYLEMAGIFVDMRGTQPGGSDQFQDRVPLRKSTEPVGHAMHATYLYATAADIFAETGDETLRQSIERLWHSVTERRMYVTGAVGPIAPGISPRRDVVTESFGKDWELPNRDGYNETCANIGNLMWQRRMLAITGEARYADVMEQVLYNSVISGMGQDGSSFFYTNVHRRYGSDLPRMHNETMQRWHNTTEEDAARSFCCPPNVLRTLFKSANWAYGVAPGAVWVHLYGAGTLTTSLPGGGQVKLAQQTEYPWEGRVRIAIEEAPAAEMALMLRIPAWAEGATVEVNGKPAAIKAGAYAELRRAWRKGDSIELDMPMAARLVEAHPAAETLRGQAAVLRGPLVYCLESPDLPAGVKVAEVRISASTRFAPKREPALLGGVTVLETQCRARQSGDWANLLYRPLAATAGRTIPVRLIPYYAWSNRGLSHMTVWIPLGD